MGFPLGQKQSRHANIPAPPLWASSEGSHLVIMVVKFEIQSTVLVVPLRRALRSDEH